MYFEIWDTNNQKKIANEKTSSHHIRQKFKKH